jgi:serine/threonine-protein kinase PknG
MPETTVPASLRRCGNCNAAVARGDGDRPPALDGRCGRCGHPYSFTVKLQPNEIVGRYKVVGPVAHGGQGWVYAALDRNLAFDGRPDGEQVQSWVALKGLLDTANPEARQAVEAERRFLTSVNHPNIVKIRDFIVHNGADYIVMDYVRGLSLAKVMKQQGRCLPPADAVRYLLRLLPALGYLHRLGLVYCDLKPENVMVTSGDLTLIDLGGVRHQDDRVSPFLSTPEYRAPELDDAGHRGDVRRLPSIASDLYAAARTLSVLALGRGLTSEYRNAVPPADAFPVLGEYDSLRRVLLKGMAREPDDRFGSADEMADELVGVLREIVARTEGSTTPVASRWFDGLAHATGEDADGRPLAPGWSALPMLQVDRDDPARPVLTAMPVRDDPAGFAERLASLTPATREVRLMLARARIEAGRLSDARRVLDRMEKEYPREWRVRWYQGLAELAAGQPKRAMHAFDHVYAQVPGELAPRLALATAAEAAGDLDRAAELFDVVSRIDGSITSAAFGLARCRHDAAARIEAYERVPQSSRAFVSARMRIIELLVGPDSAAVAISDALERASAILTETEPELRPDQRSKLRLRILNAAERLARSGTAPAGTSVLGCPVKEQDLHLAQEKTLRALARLAPTRGEQIRLVDEANQARPWTWL